MKAYIQKVTTPAQSSFIFRTKTAPRFAFGWHFHPEYELTLIERGRGQRYVGDSIEDYESGDLVLLGPNLPHTWYSGPIPSGSSRSGPSPSGPRGKTRHRAIIVHFAASFLGERFFDCPEMKPARRLLGRSAVGLQFLGRARDEAARRLVAMRGARELERLTELLRILDLLATGGRVRALSSVNFAPSLHRANQRRIDRVCQFVSERYTESISQADVADRVGMSPPVFSRFFKRTVGRTFVEYLAELRVGHACRLLIESELSVVDISLRSGFNNLSNFNRRFLKLKSMSPRQYRAHHRTGLA